MDPDVVIRDLLKTAELQQEELMLAGLEWECYADSIERAHEYIYKADRRA